MCCMSFQWGRAATRWGKLSSWPSPLDCLLCSVVARLEDPTATGIAVADINLDQLEAVRTKMPIHAHRTKGVLSLQPHVVRPAAS